MIGLLRTTYENSKYFYLFPTHSFVFILFPYNNTRYEKVLTSTNILLLISEKDIVASLESVS